MRLSKEAFDFGRIFNGGVYESSLEVLEGADEIHYVTGTCGCTEVSFKGDKISVKFTPERSVGVLNKGETKFKPVFVNIYLDANEPEFIRDDKGVRVSNPNKKKITLPINYLAVGK